MARPFQPATTLSSLAGWFRTLREANSTGRTRSQSLLSASVNARPGCSGEPSSETVPPSAPTFIMVATASASSAPRASTRDSGVHKYVAPS